MFLKCFFFSDAKCVTTKDVSRARIRGPFLLADLDRGANFKEVQIC